MRGNRNLEDQPAARAALVLHGGLCLGVGVLALAALLREGRPQAFLNLLAALFSAIFSLFSVRKSAGLDSKGRRCLLKRLAIVHALVLGVIALAPPLAETLI